MNTMLMIDTMSSRYHCLPSESLARATTVDLYILSQVLGYYHRKNNPDSIDSAAPELTQEELAEILKRNKNNDNKN